MTLGRVSLVVCVVLLALAPLTLSPFRLGLLAKYLCFATVADGIAATDPFAVDVASGTEASPGVKDPAKVEAFFAAANPPAAEPAAAPTEPSEDAEAVA